MQYFIKVYNADLSEFLGYYKESGIGCITKLPKGTKYFNDLDEARMCVADLDGGFVRASDGHYYRGMAIIYGDATRTPSKSTYRQNIIEEEERKHEIEAFIRKNSPIDRE